jgi:hypothetical protein
MPHPIAASVGSSGNSSQLLNFSYEPGSVTYGWAQ